MHDDTFLLTKLVDYERENCKFQPFSWFHTPAIVLATFLPIYYGSWTLFIWSFVMMVATSFAVMTVFRVQHVRLFILFSNFLFELSEVAFLSSKSLQFLKAGEVIRQCEDVSLKESLDEVNLEMTSIFANFLRPLVDSGLTYEKDDLTSSLIEQYESNSLENQLRIVRVIRADVLTKTVLTLNSKLFPKKDLATKLSILNRCLTKALFKLKKQKQILLNLVDMKKRFNSVAQKVDFKSVDLEYRPSLPCVDSKKNTIYHHTGLKVLILLHDTFDVINQSVYDIMDDSKAALKHEDLQRQIDNLTTTISLMKDMQKMKNCDPEKRRNQVKCMNGISAEHPSTSTNFDELENGTESVENVENECFELFIESQSCEEDILPNQNFEEDDATSWTTRNQLMCELRAKIDKKRNLEISSDNEKKTTVKVKRVHIEKGRKTEREEFEVVKLIDLECPSQDVAKNDVETIDAFNYTVVRKFKRPFPARCTGKTISKFESSEHQSTDVVNDEAKETFVNDNNPFQRELGQVFKTGKFQSRDEIFTECMT